MGGNGRTPNPGLLLRRLLRERHLYQEPKDEQAHPELRKHQAGEVI